MTQKDVVQTLSSLDVGTVIAWVVVLAALGATIFSVVRKLYDLVARMYCKKAKEDEVKAMVKDHDAKLESINATLLCIQDMLHKQDEYTLKSMRYDIVRACEEAILRGSITIREYASLQEMYDEYHEKRHGNGYVSSLMKKLEKIEIIGALDEHGEDIEE